VTIRNGSDESIELLISGPTTARTLSLPPCDGCQTFSSEADGYCAAGSPQKTITLPEGTVTALVRSPSDTSITPFVGNWQLRPGYSYSECYYVSQSQFPPG
jgi:hypothetical protein